MGGALADLTLVKIFNRCHLLFIYVPPFFPRTHFSLLLLFRRQFAPGLDKNVGFDLGLKSSSDAFLFVYDYSNKYILIIKMQVVFYHLLMLEYLLRNLR